MNNDLVNLLNPAPRCSAKSKRSGVDCPAPAVRSHRVCRMRGAGGGAPRGGRMATIVTGRFTCQAIEERLVLALPTPFSRSLAANI